jgi:hypothetical protein
MFVGAQVLKGSGADIGAVMPTRHVTEEDLKAILEKMPAYPTMNHSPTPDTGISSIPPAEGRILTPNAPYIWPDNRVFKRQATYATAPPFEQLLADADLISGVLVGVDDFTIGWLQNLLSLELARNIHLIIILNSAGPTRESHLRALLMVQNTESTGQKKVNIRLLPVNRRHGVDFERPTLPPTVIQGYQSITGRTIMAVGSVADSGHDPFNFGSLNLVFQPDDALRDSWRNWFQFTFECATPLTLESVAIPHLIPAEGDPEATRLWKEFMKLCQNHEGTFERIPQVDPETGEVTAGSDGEPVQAWDAGMTALDPLAQVFQQVYAKGWLVTVDEATRIKPLTIPVKATLMGQMSERTVGALKQKQSFSLQVLDVEVDKAMEKSRKVTDLLDLLAFPLSTGNRWLPEDAQLMIETEIATRNTAGQAALVKALGGKEAKDIAGFIASKRDSIRKDLNEMYRLLGKDTEVPPDKFEAVLKEVEDRLAQALNTRVTPRLVFNRIAAPDLTAIAPDTNWSQPLNLLLRVAIALRKALVDPYFPRSFSGLNFGEAEFRKACDPFGDEIAASKDSARAREELRVLAKISDSSAPSKSKCMMVWSLIRGMPSFYFETHFKGQDKGWEVPEEFSILTAFATTGKQWTDAQNKAADLALEHELRSDGKCLSRLTGFSPETLHAEPGWVAAIGWDVACDLGLKYKQDAIYHVKGDELFVSYCDGSRALVPVGMFRERLDGGKGTANP